MSVLLVAHGAWITNYLALLRDLFPGNSIATIIGLTGTAGGIGGMLSTLAIGPVVDRFSFVPVFAVSGVLYPLALLCILRASRSDSLISDGTSNAFASSSALNA
jgi:ACS family hexuronate transporter-like MFS transporter